MIYHIMADGTRRDSLEGCILPKEISESVVAIIFGKEKYCVRTDKTRTVKKE